MRAVMRFSLLGTLQVSQDDGTPVTIRQPRCRALMVILLLHAGRPVMSGRLADMLWGENMPRRGPTGALHTHICQLRKLLPGGRLARVDTGYQLAVRPGELDLEEFRRFTALGQRELDEHRHLTAADLLSQGLGLWREPHLADAPATQPMCGVICQILEEHQAARESLIEARLALGHHRSLLPELRAQVIAQPENERLRGYLMLALYRSGRRTEALSAYRHIAATLADGYGIDPGPDLQRLHQQVLTDQLSLR